ncbi:protein-glutamine glutaminase family protein [Peredibacter sp. HCB2-198]|uniref:protein-glutamine glutaminase family protein n=1 Tax=Peredibacter sp. HCB2-198 TaxID=3383025 RepID=UPI0038B49945
MKSLALAFLFPLSVFAQTITIEEFKYPVRDISTLKLNKEDLYKSMDLSLIKPKDSICSSRAHMWAFDFKKKFEVDSPKIFLFFTRKNNRHGEFTWWYHVAPMVNEKGKLWVMDKGFPKKFNSPLLPNAWMKKFVGENTVCREIKAGEDDLVERMFKGSSFPVETQYGSHDCYYKFTPAGYVTPESVAKNILGKDADGRPVNFNRDDFNLNEVFNACLEAHTAPWGWAVGAGQQACRNFVRN